MDITRKNLSDTKVQLTITVGSLDLEAAEQVALTKLVKDLKVPGFRAGKVPISIASKHVDPAKLAEQSLDDAISKAVAEAFISEEIQVLNRPEVEVKKFVPRETLEFTAEVEMLPVVKLGDYKKLSAKAEKVSVKQADVDDIIERMRSGMASKKETTGPAKEGDDVIIDFVGKKGDVAFDGGTAADYRLTLGSNQFIPGFEEGIVGYKAGETFDLNLEFPSDYQVADLAGQKVVFSVTLKKVEESELPEVDEAFAKKAGPFKTVDELKADIKRELLEQKTRETTDKLKDELVGELVEKSKVPVPEILIDDQAKSIERDFEQNLAYRGMTIEQYVEAQKFSSVEDWREKEVKQAAIKRVKAGLVLAELSKELKVEATNEELEAHIDVYKQQYGSNPEALKQFETPDVRRDIANRLLTEKTVNQLLELNTK
jgi:trigger factor